ncbi:uracil-DNA glycosylase [Rhodothalassium salexigens]|uniref:uracil-DNA glycosylase family protein n=1 Tax=Rhodothalassium salexigens TaxID=1086 RepID=UPI0019126F4E|nr:uracil-DNA glycosylase family protein [Rhodothalassium salexigens]MBK5920558.1 uracil-DNA glycosylase [Rhodothalassium salexigens]
MTQAETVACLLREIRACRLCAETLPLGPRPVVQASATARILVAAQAPGTRVHATGLPFNDPSGDRLRRWMGVDRATFYDAGLVNIVPMGFCYPGRAGRGGDRPPRRECARTWHDRLFAALAPPRLTLVIGQYAHAYHLGAARGATLTDTVRNWRRFWPHRVPMPHPSPRNTHWLQKNPWFEAELVPRLRDRVAEALDAARADLADGAIRADGAHRARRKEKQT